MRWFGYLVAFTLCTVWLGYTLTGYLLAPTIAVAVWMLRPKVVTPRVTKADFAVVESWLT
jgi:hypothetical protein